MKSEPRLCIFRIGQLGDLLVATPALWVIRENFPQAHLTLLSEKHLGKSYVSAPQVFGDRMDQ